MIHIKNLDPNKINVNVKAYKSIFRYTKIDSVNHLFNIIDEIKRRIEESNGNKYLILVSNNDGKDTLKKCEELWDKIRNINKSITNDSGNYDEKYLKNI